MSQSKKCTGCKEVKSLENFYKNKLIADGHANYCIACTKENSKKYFKRKKEKLAKVETESMMKSMILSENGTTLDIKNTDTLMRIMMIEKMCKSILNELSAMKSNLMVPEPQEMV